MVWYIETVITNIYQRQIQIRQYYKKAVAETKLQGT